MKRERIRCGFSVAREREEKQQLLNEFTFKLEYLKREREHLTKKISLEMEKENQNQSQIEKDKEILMSIEREIVSLTKALESYNH